MTDAIPNQMAGDVAPILMASAWWGGLGAVGVALVLGWALLPRLRRWRWGDAWLLRAVVGLVPANLAVLLLGQVPGLLWRFPWSALGAAGWALLLVTLVRHRRRRRPGFAHRRPFDRLGGLLAAVWLIAALAPAFCPPLSYDVLEYHLGYVTHIFATGQVRPIPHVFYTAQPLATEMLFTLAAVIEGSPWGYGPGVLHWLLIVLGSLIFVRLAAALAIPRRWRPLLLLVLLAHPLICKLYLDRFTDWTGLLLFAAALWMWRRASLLGPGRSAFLMGLLVGAAVCAKWTNTGTVAVPVMLFVLFGQRKPSTWLGRWRAAGLCLAGAAAAWGPWAVWLGAVRHNPFAPFAAGLFPTTDWTPSQLAFLMQTHGPLSPVSGAYWANLARRIVLDLPSPPLLALALGGYGVWLAARRGRGSQGTAIHLMAVSIFVSLLLWGRLRNSADRFLAPTMLLAVLLLGMLLRQLCAALNRESSWLARQNLWRYLAVLMILFTALPGARQFVDFMTRGPFIPHALGRLSRGAYYEQGLGATAGLFEAANRLGNEAHLLAINEARRYPFDCRVDLASVFDVNPIRNAIRGAADAAEIERRLLATGYTHLLCNGFEQNRILAMHTPPALMGDPGLADMLRRNDQAGLARTYWGFTEFATEPLTAPERKAYGDFLNLMRRRAIWSFPPAGAPAMWVAPLGGPETPR